MMDATVKAKWLTALRSGEYKQGRKKLCEKGAYCCLGVLADQQDWFTDKSGAVWVIDDFQGTLPWERELEVGLSTVLSDKLIRMNDSGKSFAEIADYIEANL